MEPNMDDLVLIARKIGETAGIPNHIERAKQVREVVLKLEAERIAMLSQEQRERMWLAFTDPLGAEFTRVWDENVDKIYED